MKRRDSETAGAALACDSCGQLPHPEKVRLTLANVAAMLPIELLVHAAVVHAALPYVLKVLVLTVTATVLVIWVAEPSARHALRGWLHAPALRHRCRLRSSPSLWHIHALADNPDGQQKLAETISKAGADILIQQSRGVAGAVLGELVVGAPDHVTHADLSIH
ncbi:amino acid-binding protein, partial [Arthrobacter sp. I2-34]|nr:amino acid-binding protein [Arthrobacter hankyongi]